MRRWWAHVVAGGAHVVAGVALTPLRRRVGVIVTAGRCLLSYRGHPWCTLERGWCSAMSKSERHVGMLDPYAVLCLALEDASPALSLLRYEPLAGTHTQIKQ